MPALLGYWTVNMIMAEPDLLSERSEVGKLIKVEIHKLGIPLLKGLSPTVKCGLGMPDEMKICICEIHMSTNSNISLISLMIFVQ
jgi:hypothetical protein